MTLSNELTKTTQSQHKDTINCFALKGMGFVGTFKTKNTAKKVSKEWGFALKATTNKIEKVDNGYKVTTLFV